MTVNDTVQCWYWDTALQYQCFYANILSVIHLGNGHLGNGRSPGAITRHALSLRIPQDVNKKIATFLIIFPFVYLFTYTQSTISTTTISILTLRSINITTSVCVSVCVCVCIDPICILNKYNPIYKITYKDVH